MNDRSGPGLAQHWKYIVPVALMVLIGAHLIPYTNTYVIPHNDYLNVIEVLDFLLSPESFPEESITEAQAFKHTQTAPIYYYAIALPLAYILPAKWVLLSIGFTISCFCAYYTGYPWNKKRHFLYAVLIVFILLNVYLSPLEGNRRSFTAFFLLAALWLGNDPDYPWILFFVALSAGIYPPAALILMVYFGLLEIRNHIYGQTPLVNVATRSGGMLLVSLLVLSPYWLNAFFLSPDLQDLSVPELAYEMNSIHDFIDTFFFGENLQHRGALLRKPFDTHLFFFGILLVGLEFLVLGKKFTFRTRYGLLALASILLWALAHVTHPLIYQPVKYTRLSLLLVVFLLFVTNLPDTTNYLRKRFYDPTSVRILLYFLAGWQFILWMSFEFSFLDSALVRSWTGIPNIWIKFFLLLPIFLVILIALPNLSGRTAIRSLVASLVLFGGIFYPFDHGRTDVALKKLKKFELDFRVTDLSGLYDHLKKKTPSQATIAGPPYLMTAVQPFGKRIAYVSTRRTGLPGVCRRYRQVWKVYFTGDPDHLLDFMRKNNIDRFLVDRKFYQLNWFVGNLRCLDQLLVSKEPVLDRDFQDALWSIKERYYLIDKNLISSLPKSKTETLEISERLKQRTEKPLVPIQLNLDRLE